METTNIHTLRAHYDHVKERLTITHPQLGDILQRDALPPGCMAFIDRWFRTASTCNPSPADYRHFCRELTGLQDDFGLLRQPAGLSLPFMHILLDAYQSHRAIFVEQLPSQCAGSPPVFGGTPLFVQAGPDRFPRLHTLSQSRGGLRLPKNICAIRTVKAP